jgi:hypothetical protein
MAIELTEKNGGELEVSVTGKLVKDYDAFAPAVERAFGQHDKIRILIVMHDFP